MAQAITELKTATAATYLSVDVDCPHCDESLDIRETLSDCEAWLPNRLDIPKCEVEITCTNCQNQFMVTKVDF